MVLNGDLRPSMLAVDEVHCALEWDDFRVDYAAAELFYRWQLRPVPAVVMQCGASGARLSGPEKPEQSIVRGRLRS